MPATLLKHLSGWFSSVKRINDANSSCIFCMAHPANNSCCDSCRAAMPVILRACRLCALPLEYSLNGNLQTKQQGITNYHQDAAGYLCPSCYSKPPAVDFIWSPYAYYPPLSKALHLLKFSRLIYYGFVLGSLWKQMYLHPLGDNKPSKARPDLILPMPLHFRRQGSRGFNQAAELIEPLGKELGIPISKGNDGLCQRVRPTAPQTDLAPKDRSENIRDAFAINPKSSDYATMSGKSILVVDDVVTTGSTINEVARCLKKAGAAQVIAWSLLRV
ncbi:MAG: ComF family protein [Gammaproteobacteria bacterium]|nr:ComF family protein [Gammaproteobacteria bacterium]